MPSRRTPLMELSENDATSTANATTNKRQSGRAVRAPEKFRPDAPSSHQGITNGKRKRGDNKAGQDVENEEEDEEGEDEESDEDEESADEEEFAKSKKRSKTTKKPVAKKPKVNGSTGIESAPAVKLPNRPKKAKRVAIIDESAEGLYGKMIWVTLCQFPYD